MVYVLYQVGRFMLHTILLITTAIIEVSLYKQQRLDNALGKPVPIIGFV